MATTNNRRAVKKETALSEDSSLFIQDPIAPAKEPETLDELKAMAMNTNLPVGPDALPGRFNNRAEGTIHAATSMGIVEDAETIARRQAMVDFYQSYLRKRILTGTIKGVRTMFDRGAEKSNNLHYFVTVLYHPYQVFIPIEKFTDTDLEAMWKRFTDNGSVKTLAETIKTYLEARIGAEVDFIITNLPEDGALETALFVGGDRVEALRRKRIRFWYGTQKDGQPLIREGDKAQARIVSVIRGGILIEIFGVETFIPARELSYTLIQDCKQHFSPGSPITVTITNIKRDEENDYAVHFNASAKLAMPDPRIAGMILYQPNGVYVGEIIYLSLPDEAHPNRTATVFVKFQDGVQCACPFPNGSIPPQQGAKVFVRITVQDTEHRRLYGLITHVESSM